MAHCIGMRHTDWFNRSLSCGLGGNEGEGTYGACTIPGTPTSPWVQVFSGTSSYGVAVCRHVMIHEIGHCIGFRHTDWFNRSLSCGTGGNEGQSSYGACTIPGTPNNSSSTWDSGSFMNSCFSTSSTGAFSAFDIVALNWLY